MPNKEDTKNHGFDTVTTLGFKVFSDNLLTIPITADRCRVINTISPNSYGLATKDPIFKGALQKTDYLVLDGVYFALASIFLLGKNITKNQGPDVFRHFMARLNENSGKVFFLGSSQHVLQKIEKKIVEEYPKISVGCFSPPFKKEFSTEDNNVMLSKVNAFKPTILFLGMTAPKQEKWSVQHREKLNCHLVISIGNVFDWYAGTKRAIHPFFYKIRIGWLVRIFIRPEMLKRNLGNQMLFLWHLFLVIFGIKKVSDD
jgi:N-acetylglucosaminyldiphosphoundecaprenol N-acetyl-beta-D-mannosaminyltransferase